MSLLQELYFFSYVVDDVMKKWRGMPDTFRKEFTNSGGESSRYGADIQAIAFRSFAKFPLLLTDTVTSNKLEGKVPNVSVRRQCNYSENIEHINDLIQELDLSTGG